MLGFLIDVAGVVFLLSLLAGGVLAMLGELDADRPPESDPYRDGLDASARISAAGFEAERLMHEAADQAAREERRSR